MPRCGIGSSSALTNEGDYASLDRRRKTLSDWSRQGSIALLFNLIFAIVWIYEGYCATLVTGEANRSFIFIPQQILVLKENEKTNAKTLFQNVLGVAFQYWT